MGYSKNPKAVILMKNYLDLMVASTGTIELKTNSPTNLAYQLHNAINAAKYLATKEGKKEYTQYANLKAKYKVRVGNGVVIVEPTEITPLEILKEGMSTITLAGLKDHLELIGAAMVHKAGTLFFPDATDESILPHLYVWASSNGYYIIPSEDGTTLTQNDPGEIAWSPNEL